MLCGVVMVEIKFVEILLYVASSIFQVKLQLVMKLVVCWRGLRCVLRCERISIVCPTIIKHTIPLPQSRCERNRMVKNGPSNGTAVRSFISPFCYSLRVEVKTNIGNEGESNQVNSILKYLAISCM